MKVSSLILLVALLPAGPLRAVVIAENKSARMVIVTDPGAIPTEIFAARELAADLAKITGASFEIRTNSEAPANAIIVGPGEAARKAF